MGLGPAELAFTILRPDEVPLAKYPRWAVLGRSNVGKSTFLNALTHPHVFFKTGKNPGVTRGLIGVRIRLGKSEDSNLELVDMPGFGFSRGHSIDSAGWDNLGEALREQSIGRARAEKAWAGCIEGATEGPFWTSALKGDGMDPLFKSARSFVRNHA